jgi:hypothetical protein
MSTLQPLSREELVLALRDTEAKLAELRRLLSGSVEHHRAQADSDETHGAHIGITAYNRGLAAGFSSALDDVDELLESLAAVSRHMELLACAAQVSGAP